MTAPTVAVTVKLFDATNNPCPDGTVVSAKLDRREVYQGFIIPTTVSAPTAAGIAVLHLFPNNPNTGLGTAGSIYEFKASPTGWKSFRATAQIPNVDCQLADVADSDVIPELSAAQIAEDAAQGYAAQVALGVAAAAQSATDSEVSASNAADSATSAAQIVANVASSVGQAQDWASSPASPDGVNKSAKSYAIDAGTSAASAAVSKAAIDSRIYPGVFAVAPSTRTDGTAIQQGDMYFSGATQTWWFFAGGAWHDLKSEAASSAASALASQNSAGTSSTQAALLAGVTGVYATNAAMQAALAAIAANANVMVLADESRQGQTSIYQKSAGVMAYQGVVQTNPGTVGALGDVAPENTIWLFPGDSTTEQAGASGYLFDTLTSEYRSVGGPLQNIAGTINFGGSGHKLADWVNGAAGALPTYSTANLGVSQNDYFGHKAVGAQTLATELAWRANLAPSLRVMWAPCYGINDCILDNTVGNLSQQGISDYVTGYLRQAIRRILSAFPRDKILLRIPNPMTARPYVASAGFPSQTQYPSFGTDATADAALVDKWNQGIRNGYLAVRNEFSGVALYDKWELVYGPSNTTKTVAQLPFQGDLVHPGGNGYQQEAHQLLAFMAPTARVKRRQLNGRHAWAVAYAAIDGVQPWEKWPAYLDNNYKYQFVIEGTLNGRGTTFLDVGMNVSDFVRIARGRGIYVQVGEAAAQFFPTYQVTDQGGTNTLVRFLNVAPSAAMQAAALNLPVRIYVDVQSKAASATFIPNTLNETSGLYLPDPYPSGGVFSVSTGSAVPSTVTIDVYSVASNVRTLLGTITVTPNAFNGTLASGNPASTPAGAWYEFKVTSATVAGNRIQCKFTPN